VQTPRIAAIGTAVPARRFTQEELADLFGYGDGLRRRFFLNSGIDGRHLYMPQADLRPETIDERSARFAEGSVRLGVEAVEVCLAQAGLGVADVDFLVTTTCTGRLVPSLDAHLIGALGLRTDVQRVHVGDTGCASAMVALQQCCNHLQAFPRHRVVLVAVEICSAAYYHDDRLESAVAHAIFADGAGAIALSREGDGPGIIEHRTLFRSEHLPAMGFEYPGGRPRVVLSKEIRRIGAAMMREMAEMLMASQGLKKEDVRHFILHSAGRRVIEQARKLMDLGEGDIAPSRHVLRHFGNISSATVVFVLDEVLRRAQPVSGDWGLMIALGPGFAAEGALLRW
jgi:predicted naringenin-chalcone synthase